MDKTQNPKDGFYWTDRFGHRIIVEVVGNNFYSCGDSLGYAIEGKVFLGPIPTPDEIPNPTTADISLATPEEDRLNSPPEQKPPAIDCSHPECPLCDGIEVVCKHQPPVELPTPPMSSLAQAWGGRVPGSTPESRHPPVN